jgi:hypothetical protein
LSYGKILFISYFSVLENRENSYIKKSLIIYTKNAPFNNLNENIMKKIIYSILILAIVMISCSKDDSEETINYTIWNGPKIEFIKQIDTDPNEAINQDKITSSVSITRGNSGGQIYNVVLENESTKNTSPRGTEWAIGEISNLSNLTFSSFRSAVGSPKEVVGKRLVLHILEEDVYLSVEFKSWGEGQKGNFSYERSTDN